MSTDPNSVLIRCAIAGLMLLPARFVVAQGSLTGARDLYSAAAYDDALTMLDRLHASDYSPDDNRSIGLYRMLCLMALGRPEDAAHVVETLVTQYPSYRPSDSSMPPRARSLISDARRRMLPAIVQEQYRQAKAAWDRREFATAADGFSGVIEGLDDPDLRPVANQPPLSDLRTLAVGFHELSAQAAAPPPPPPAPAPPPRAEIAAAPPQAPPARPADGIFSNNDADVAMPIILEQSIPAPPTPVLTGRGAVEVVIDENGSVESATMKISINKMYDRLVLTAAKRWRYRPATFQGVPVKFRKIVTVAFSPPS